ncbi:redoxin domain-containing protein [Tautonia sociabilis]|uniref:Redoxin domain-containing protein n=1 Tax=Tautonia sociabilis TaxID=2080755 RepID=A0A432MH49_9BACT|nr:redoxin domain-containing protein [Tautonia sociabilis]RUL86093.1 redoxin domain-containing protein [Tautonia sociabilis]
MLHLLPVAALLLLPVATPQDQPLPEGHSNHGEAFNEGPRQAGSLMAGQGTVDFPVTTDSDEVQALMNQGVAQLHVFFYFEAERSFRQAATIEPENPMLYWGMAMANVNNADRARKFLAVAREKAESAELSRRETLYLDALSALYKEGDGIDDQDRRQGWLKGLETIVQEFRDDLDARAWLAMVAWQNSRQDGIGSREAVSLLIDSVLDRNPMHPGAHHYKIHLWDRQDDTQALASAALFAKASPGIAHAWHMPGHTYTNLKRYADASYQQEGSARVDHEYMIRDRVMPFMIHNYAHNNQWLAESLTKTGRLADAIAVARNLVEQPRDPKKNNARDSGSPQREGRRRWAEALIAFERWDELLEAEASGALDWSSEPAEQLRRAYAAGLAHAARGEPDALDERIAALKELLPKPEQNEEQEAPEGDSGEGPRPPRPLPGLEAALAELEGHRLVLEGDLDAAFERFGSADSMRPESLARLLLKAGRTEEAVARANEAVEKAENEVAPLAARVEILHAAGKLDEARAAYLSLREIAREADPDLPVLRRIEAILADWKARDGWQAPPQAPRSDLAARNRVDLDRVGPLCWSPFPAEPIEGIDTEGKTHRLEHYRGRNLVVLFYLGGDCAHCMEQLIAFSNNADRIRATGAEIIAISTDGLETTRALKDNGEVHFAMPLIADPDLDHFQRYRAMDDFEAMPLHGTFLIDAEGKVRYQDISWQPFLDVEFVISELSRINRLLGRDSAPVAGPRLRSHDALQRTSGRPGSRKGRPGLNLDDARVGQGR